MNRAALAAVAILALFFTGCAATYQEATEADLALAERGLDPLLDDGAPRGDLAVDGTLEAYIATALRQSPTLRASFERWRAAIHRIPQARRLPEPTLTYGYFIQSVETRVGPQRHRVGLSMGFPWPTKLTAGADAASIAARSKQRQFEARALTLGQQVAEVYWQLWLVKRTRTVQRDQLEVLRALSEATRVRVEVSSANLSDLNQVDLAVSRIEDVLSGLDERESALSAQLLAAIGTTSGQATPIAPSQEPDGGVPADTREALIAEATAHPRIESLELMSESSLSKVRQARADRAPSFTVGVDWIETGEAMDPNTPGSGTDPVIVMLGLKLPVWTYAYRGAEEEARSESAAFHADAIDASNQAEAAMEQALSAIRDSDRRISLYRDTLIPQAEAAYASVVGAYQTGRSTVAATLIAQRELLDLQLGLVRAQAAHAMAWARLEQIVGREVESRRETHE
jgi:outer membrane protein TolC